MTVTFVNEPAIKRHHRGRYELVTYLEAHIDGQVVIVPRKFVTDGASVPPLFWPLVSHPLSPSSLRAAILHDFQYRTQSVSRATADHTFYAALRAEGCAWVRSRAMWLAVRLFGWVGYGRR